MMCAARIGGRGIRAVAGAIPWASVALQGWLIDRLIRQHGRVLLDQDQLVDRMARIEWLVADLAGRERFSTGEAGPRRRADVDATAASPTLPSAVERSVRDGQYARYQRLQDAAILSVPPYPVEQFAGDGIVIVAGGPLYYTNAWVCLTMLRRVLGCRLPIQVWYLGAAEMTPYMVELLQRFDVECVDLLEVSRRHHTPIVGGWQAKPFAILHSPFKSVILLDADNVPLVDPAALLHTQEYRVTGAIFWPDLHTLSREHPIWDICRVRYRDEPEFETGQLVIDKQRSWKALHLTVHLNEHSDFYYGYIRGDKETFHMAWRILDQPYAMPPFRPHWEVRSINPGDAEFADVLQQRDFDGRIIFHHRTGAKWTAWGQNLSMPGFAYESVCLEALRELRQHWDGSVDPEPAVASAPAPEAEILRTRYFLYRRVGSDERVLALLPGQRIGDGGSRWEQLWRLDEEQVVESWSSKDGPA
jgi:hypothetical protein